MPQRCINVIELPLFDRGMGHTLRHSTAIHRQSSSAHHVHLRTLKPGDLPEERDAIWRGSMVGQNGKSATLTAPNGIAQEETCPAGWY